MIESLRITQLVENTAGSPGLLGEHGAAYFIEADDHCLLFDTGQGATLLSNAARLQLPLECLTAVALSHGHYDHSGGLLGVLERTGPIDVYLHPDALSPKHNRDGRCIGAPVQNKATLQEGGARLIESRGPCEIVPGVRLTGEIPRRTPLEDTGGPFYQDAERQTEDLLPDDQALFVEMAAGLVVLLGCGHAGVVNTLSWVRELTDQRPIQALIGGMHLLRASAERLDFTVAALGDLGIPYLAANHCTGIAAICRFRQAFGERCHASPVGTRHAFGTAA